ncbi:MAG: M20/M25/M40 family metallo-hydrolase [Candidatus Aenigmarchaeota archaeon]|nr:M20/M25/M40 family metallo-hydrolase [Candidatus Aenigmarchaeota archaeon]
MDSLSRCLEELVRIDSTTGKEQRIADYVEAKLAGFGLAVERSENNIIAGTGSVMLAGHLDTVPPASLGQLIPKVANGRLQGRGACDMKAGLAVMLELAQSENATFVFYSGEEGPLPNGLNLLHEKGRLQAKLAVCLEPTNLQLQTACRGRLLTKVTVAGKAGHSSLGSQHNAIYRALELVAKARGLQPMVQAHGGALAVTGIESMGPSNATPTACRILLDYRFPAGATMGEAETFLAHNISAGMEFLDRAPAYSLPKNLSAAFAKHLGPAGVCPGWTDAAQLSGWGIPCAIFGPGKLELAHADDEHVVLKQLELACERLRPLLRSQFA